jgi:Zn-dependent metalloprotease
MIRSSNHRAFVSTLLASLFPIVALAEGPTRIPALDPDGIQRLVADTGGAARVSIHKATGAARFVRLAAEGKRSLSPLSAAEAPTVGLEQKSVAFFRRYGRIFGISAPDAELELRKTATGPHGGAHLTYRQLYRGVPVFAGELKSHFDSAGRLTAVNGTFVPKIAVDPVPSTTELAAGKAAIAQVESDLESSVALSVRGTTLYVYRTGLARGVSGRSHLVWEVEVVGDGGAVREFVYIDAHTGKFVDQITGIYDALDRKAYNTTANYPNNPFWEEGDAFPTADAEANNVIDFSGDVYQFYSQVFGRDSFDGVGGTMHGVFRLTEGCPNAFWNGIFTSYCTGVSSDDAVAHEWTHAYTQYTHNLIPAWQPGALNEAYSDIFGEVVDLTNGDGVDSPGGNRTDGVCSAYIFPPVMEVNSPSNIAGVYLAGKALFGPQLTPTGITGDVALVNDGVGTTTDACTALPAGSLTGLIGLADRGSCTFLVKVKNMQNAGAIAAIIADNVAGSPPPPLGGFDGSTFTISSVRITLADGNLIKAPLPGVNVTLRLDPPPGADNSYRWLVAEDEPGFEGAIRDMWTPTCFGDPGKVSDSVYVCGTADHINNGVPNHGFALLVDGGTYNGQAVGGLGLTKAAHIYYRAMTIYQVRTSDFEDHADAIEQSCADLIGVSLTPVPGQPSGQSLTASDCDQVEKAAAAVELRTPPTQCNFQPLLAKNPPAQCAVRNFYTADFESGAGGYTASRTEVTLADFTDRDWVRVEELPDDRAGFAFFAIDPDIGTCLPGGDESGVLHLTSPAIPLPAGLSTPVLTFDHYISTELGFDGGNLKISVNGGLWQLVAATDYTYNPSNATLESAPLNTDPLAGQTAFTGSDDGSVSGSWGQSQIRLSTYASAGQTIQLRWDFGTDGCTGLIGWYVDDIRLYDRNFSATVVIDGCNTAVPNGSLPTSCTISDLIAECAENAVTHEDFTGCVTHVANDLKRDGVINNKQKADIQQCAARARIP